jgi:transposase
MLRKTNSGLKIKRYIQMQLEKNKSDKKDAKWICRYAIDQKPPLQTNV